MLYALQQRDDPYLEIVNKYDNDRPEGERPIDYYTEAFGALQSGMQQTDADLLGVVYETYGMSSDAFGQYFTPHNVSEMMAEMQLQALDRKEVGQRRAAGDPVTVKDPACGSGRLLVVAAQEYPDAVYYGVDKSETCAKMTALNLCLFNVDGYAVHGDALAMDAYQTWATQRSRLGGQVEELDVDPFAEEGSEQGDGDSTEGVQDAHDVTVRTTTLSDF